MNKTLLAATLLAATSFSAQASELSYTFVEANYAQANFDDVDLYDININPTLVGWGLNGSFAIADNFYAFGGYSSGKDDVLNYADVNGTYSLDVSVDRTNIGFGYHMPVSDKTDFIAELSYIQYDYDFDYSEVYLGNPNSESIKIDTSGARLSAGLRGQLFDSFEGYAKLNFTDSQDIEGDFGGNIGGQYKFNQTWGITGDIEFAKDAAIYTFGVRASF